MYKDLINVVALQQTAKFEKHMKILGIVGVALIPGACIFIGLGWLYPIYTTVKADVDAHLSPNNYAFMMLHMVMMVVIIIPWCCVFFIYQYYIRTVQIYIAKYQRHLNTRCPYPII